MFRTSTRRGTVAIAVVISLATPLVGAADLFMRFFDSTNAATATVEVIVETRNPDGSWGSVSVLADIPPRTPADVKRDLIKTALQQTYGAAAVTDAGPAALKLHLETTGAARLRFDPGGTGELADAVICARAASAQPAFQGFFQPFDSNHQPALFTAGIVTDVGELTEVISAQELNFQTDGPIICQALFQRLAPRAPQYGAQINYAGDRLEIYFDPAYTVTQGGLIFGTNSGSPGCSGTLEIPPPTPPSLPGDLNCDGVVDFYDINAFVLAISDPLAYQAAYPGCNIMNGDCNGDGVVDFGDINDFVALLTH
jgi:hypothetical protein